VPDKIVDPTRRYPKNEPVYYRFLDSSRPLDRAILDTLRELGQPGSEERSDLHNDLGVLLLRFGYEKDARREITVATKLDRKNYVAWFNLGLVEELAGNDRSALAGFRRCLEQRPGHADALFHTGLVHERAGRRERAVEAYAKAYRYESRLLDVRYNPQILDTKLVAETLAASGPQRSLAKALPTEIMDGTRIGRILASREPEAAPAAAAAAATAASASTPLPMAKGGAPAATASSESPRPTK
jgi:tetratricopeptide (TPR) repeat protein